MYLAYNFQTQSVMPACLLPNLIQKLTWFHPQATTAAATYYCCCNLPDLKVKVETDCGHALTSCQLQESVLAAFSLAEHAGQSVLDHGRTHGQMGGRACGYFEQAGGLAGRQASGSLHAGMRCKPDRGATQRLKCCHVGSHALFSNAHSPSLALCIPSCPLPVLQPKSTGV